jgi:3-hydroxy-9,10-secoandrosta-1,3,5(10)-triene-9,17-dione monooxygenase
MADPAFSAPNIPTPAEVVARATALAPALASRADECERRRCVPEATIADYIDAGLHKIMQPQRYGGWGMGWDTLCESAVEFGKGDGSQAWVLTVYGDHAHMLGTFEAEAQDEVWADDPTTLASTCFAPLGKMARKDGGYVVSGKWSFSSGIDHAKWILAGAMLHEGAGAPQYVFFLAPKSSAKVIDDWHVTGLAGTGSKSFTMDEVFVPPHRILLGDDHHNGTGPGIKVNPEPTYRFPRRGAFVALASVPVGVGYTMLEDFVALATDSARRGKRAEQNYATALRIAECRADLDAARLSATAAARETMEMLERGETPGFERRTLNSLKSAYAAMVAARAADRLFAASGAKGNFLSSRLQRSLLDIHAASTHVAVAWDMAAAKYGRLRLGEDVSGDA